MTTSINAILLHLLTLIKNLLFKRKKSTKSIKIGIHEIMTFFSLVVIFQMSKISIAGLIQNIVCYLIKKNKTTLFHLY